MKLLQPPQSKYGRLTIVSEPYRKGEGKNTYTMVSTICDCGTKKEVRLAHLKDGLIISCKCFNKEEILTRSTTHGLVHHPLYNVWMHAKRRCYNPQNKAYYNYGGRGVRMCNEWRKSFVTFYEWAIDKWKPGLELDKDKLSPKGIGVIYCPQYCSFLTPKENNRYKRNQLTFQQVQEIKELYATGDYTLKKVGDKYNVCQSAIHAIIKGVNWN